MRIKKTVSLALCFLLLVTSVFVPTTGSFATEKSIEIRLNDKKIETLTLEPTQKEVLTAATMGILLPSLQWQVLLDEEKQDWVNIYDKTKKECEISYATIKHAMGNKDYAYIRCAATENEETIYSNSVRIIITEPPQDPPQVTRMAQTRYVANEQESEDNSVLGKALLDNNDDYVTITIKYLDVASINGEEASIYSPYIASIKKGTEFSQKVISPTFIGFAPYTDDNEDNKIDENDKDASVLILNYPKVEENIEIKVYYKPIKVNYGVKYFFQNINDDLYTEDPGRYFAGKAETGTIVENDFLQEQAGNTVGFTKMFHIPENVAADGSTVFECYYDRNYYLIQFDLDGGYGVDPIYARYGTPFVVNNPVKPGYDFAGWELVNADANADGLKDNQLPPDAPAGMVDTIPACNYYYKAIWNSTETEYTVVYWLRDSNDATRYNYIGSRTIGATSSDTVSGSNDLSSAYLCGRSDHSHTDSCKIDARRFDFVKADQNILVKGDGSTVVNVYYKPKEYTLKFYYAKETDGKYYVAGNSTEFAYEASDNMEAKFNRAKWGRMMSLPVLNANGLSKGYTTGSEKHGDSTYYYLSFTAVYNENIGDIWPIDIFDRIQTYGTFNFGDYAYFSAWNVEHHMLYSTNNGNKTMKGKILTLSDPILYDLARYTDSTTVNFLAFWENGITGLGWNRPNRWTYNIYLPVNGDETPDTIYNGIGYRLEDTFQLYDNNTNTNPNEQTATTIEGYKEIARQALSAGAIDSYSDAYIMNYYYAAEKHNLKFTNYGNLDATYNNIAYSTHLEEYNYEPEYPDTLEENAYRFAGWYTTPDCFAGTEIDWDTFTMPDSDVMLYAKWEPLVHKATFFMNYNDMKDYEGGKSAPIYYQKDVSHGEVVGSVTTPTNSEDGLTLIFAGWFYIENGSKKAYSPLSFPINRDLNLFAEWSSHSAQPYKISYVLKSDPTKKVADDTTGFAYGGTTRTFNAKAGSPFNQLYDEYNEGYFPTVSSHSITIQADERTNPTKNVYTFTYVKATDVKYTIRYVDKKTGALLEPPVTYNTTSAVITERFKAFPNMVPDAFYKRLTLEVKENENGDYVGTENNVITFYYTPNTTSAYYAVHFMVEKMDATPEEEKQFNIDGSGGYEETGAHIEGIGTINETVYVNASKLSGFTHLDNDTVPLVVVPGSENQKTELNDIEGGYPIKISGAGTELYFFYARNQYDYVVNYYKYNTTEALKPTKTSRAFYEKEITENAPKIDGYACVTEKSKTIKIMGTEDGGTNEITFYYSPLQYIAEYVAVTTDGGTLSRTIEVVTGSDQLLGSTPTPKKGYEFGGWYLDEECTQSANETGTYDTETNHFLPHKDEMRENDRNIYYAKFVRKTDDLTIKRTDALKDGQSYVYQIRNTDTDEVYYATIDGGTDGGDKFVTIKNLPHGNYIVTQQNSWSWRYETPSQSITFNGPDTVTFSGTASQKWINGFSKIYKNKSE